MHNEAITKIVWCQPELILSGSYDHSIKFFDLSKLESLNQISCKDSTPISLDFMNNLIMAGFEDGNIKLFCSLKNITILYITIFI